MLHSRQTLSVTNPACQLLQEPESHRVSKKLPIIEGIRQVRNTQLPLQHSRQLAMEICFRNEASMKSCTGFCQGQAVWHPGGQRVTAHIQWWPKHLSFNLSIASILLFVRPWASYLTFFFFLSLLIHKNRDNNSTSQRVVWIKWIIHIKHSEQCYHIITLKC